MVNTADHFSQQVLYFGGSDLANAVIGFAQTAGGK